MNQQHVFKKHVAAIHVSNNISLLQRKLSNVLLLNAYAELRDEKILVHSVPLNVVCDMIGFDSHNYDYLRDALHGMVTTAIRWNLSDDAGVVALGSAAILSQAEILPRKGIIEYAYPPKLREMMSDPSIYALIDVRVQKRFQSAYGLALFENCLRYVNVGQTPVWSLDKFKMLVGSQDGSYDDFKLLNFHVIKKSIKEVNDVSPIEVNSVLHKEGRRVVGVQFTVHEKVQGSLQLDAPLFNEELMHRLVDEFELSETQAKSILALYSEEYINGNLEVVTERFQAGKIKEIAPYTLKALHDDFRTKPSSLRKKKEIEAAAKIKRTQEMLAQQSKVKLKTEEAKDWFSSLNETDKQAMIDQYRVSPKAKPIKAKLEKHGMDNPMVQADFFNFVARSMPNGKQTFSHTD